ncbi:ASST-domain-containing protein [Pestalotiopsis sp. NC0098]|nr:ASST-domain-containing protein [Pestalotiopsis sp. NC0098]
MYGNLLRTLACAAAVFQGLVLGDDFKHEYEAYNAAKFGVYPNNDYKGTNAKSPLLQINSWEKESLSKSGSHVFLRHNLRQDTWGNQNASPLILDAEDLTAVYINRSFPVVFNVRVQEDRGKKYLTFYGDKLVAQGLGDGYCHIYNSSYREVWKVGAIGLKTKADLHECELTGHGTVILSAYQPDTYDTPAGVKSNPTSIRESLFQEIDLDTNKVLFTWRGSEHVDIFNSFEGHNSPWDYFHINTIQKTPEGNYLVSGRHMHSIYLVSGATGEVLWTLGGRRNEFVELPPADGAGLISNPALAFAWQHHTRLYPGTENSTAAGVFDLTFFDNHKNDHSEAGCERDCSRGLHVRLDTRSTPKTVQLVREYRHPAGLLSQSQGSVQVLDNGNVFVGWGRMPAFTEHTPNGSTVWDVQFSPWMSKTTAGHALDNYRAFKQDWKATPYWPPAANVKTRKGDRVAYLSWNGATEVKSWVVYASKEEDQLTGDDNVVARLPRGGFETELALAGLNVSYLRAEALDRQSRVLASTAIVDAKSGKVVNSDAAVVNVIHDDEEDDAEDDVEDGEEAWTSLDYAADQDWQTAMVIFVVFGMGLSACCLSYALVLNRCFRCGREKEQAYTSL